MTRIKALIGLATACGLLCIAAAPASAWWETNNGTSHGPGQLKAGTVAEFQINQTAPILKCEKVPNEWKIRKQDKLQEPELTAGHLNIISKWEACKVEAILQKIPVSVAGCELQLAQEKGVFTAIGSVVTTCVIVIELKPSCTIEVGPQNNQQLGKTVLSNVETKNQEDKSEISGITSTIPASTPANKENAKTCKGLLGEAGKEGHFKATTIQHEVKAV